MKLLGFDCNNNKIEKFESNRLVRILETYEHPKNKNTLFHPLIQVKIEGSNDLIYIEHILKSHDELLFKIKKSQEEYVEFNQMSLGSIFNTDIYIGKLSKHNYFGWKNRPIIFVPDQDIQIKDESLKEIEIWSKKYSN